MKKLVLSVLALTMIMSSCSNNGKKAETKEAGKVEVVQNKGTSSLNVASPDSHVQWRASHLGGMQKRFGKVSIKNIDVLVNGGKLANASVEMDMASLTVESFNEGAAEGGDLTQHLKSADFFDVANHPTSKFELLSVKSKTGAYNSSVTGNLTIMKVTKSITFDANISISPDKVSIVSEDFSVNRTDWDLSYHTEGTPNVPVDYLIANDLGLTINATVSR